MRVTMDNSPLLGVGIALAAGIVVCHYVSDTAIISMWVAVVVIAALVILGGAWWVVRKSSRPIAWTSFIVLGYFSCVLHQALQPTPLENDVPKQCMAVVTDQAQRVGQSRWCRTSARMIAARDTGLYNKTGAWVEHRNNIQLYLDTAIVAQAPAGTTIYFKTRLRNLDGSYGDHLRRQGFDHKAYIYHIEVLGYDSTAVSNLRVWRNRMTHKLNAADSSGLSSALVLGDKQDMGTQLKQQYRLTGMSHMLAVSGLHVGIVFAILNLLLGVVRLADRGRIISGIIIVILLWGYAAVTGFSPSVVRAVVMFSVVQIGIMSSRSSTPLNTLSFAWIAILIWNPTTLFDIGFQLSFAAMVTIITLYPTLSSLWQPQNKPLRWLWQLTAVGLSAQLGVTPLVALYFGQIPLLGIVLSPVLWFTVPVIIITGFTYLITNITVAGATMATVAKAQNMIINLGSTADFTVINDARISTPTCVLCYALIIALIISVNSLDDKLKALNLEKSFKKATRK